MSYEGHAVILFQWEQKPKPNQTTSSAMFRIRYELRLVRRFK